MSVIEALTVLPRAVLLLYRIEVMGVYLVVSLMSGLVNCGKGMELAAGADDILGVGKTDFTDSRLEAAIKAAAYCHPLNGIGRHHTAPPSV